MNWVDVAVLAVVAFSGLLGFMRGLVREVFGLIAWVGAAVVAVWLFPQLQPLARRSISNPDVADPVAFGVVFLVVLIVLSLIARLFSGLARRSVLGGLDRTLGLVFGLARGAVVMVAAYLIAGVIEPIDRWPDEVLDARTLPLIYRGAAWTYQRLPDGVIAAPSMPPVGRQASAADLLHANPVGRALAAPPARQ